MGNSFGKKKEIKILMTGLNSSGKTTIIYKLRSPFDRNGNLHIPTIGNSIEEAYFKHLNFMAFDVGFNGLNIHKTQFHSLYKNTKAVIWTVDCTDIDCKNISYPNQIQPKISSRNELHFLLNKKELQDVVLLIFANKIDLPNALSLDHILECLDVTKLKQKWFAIQTCAITGDYIYEGLDWIHNITQKHSKHVYPSNGEQTLWFSSKKHQIIFENRLKTILFISGWIRKYDLIHKLNISCDLTKTIHVFYQDPDTPFDLKYQYYG
eukprot:553400_1